MSECKGIVWVFISHNAVKMFWGKRYQKGHWHSFESCNYCRLGIFKNSTHTFLYLCGKHWIRQYKLVHRDHHQEYIGLKLLLNRAECIQVLVFSLGLVSVSCSSFLVFSLTLLRSLSLLEGFFRQILAKPLLQHQIYKMACFY